MTLTVEAFDRAFGIADGIKGGREEYGALLLRLGIDADVFEWLYTTVAGGSVAGEPGDEDRLATYMLGVVTALLAAEPQPADFIQVMPMRGDRWRGLSDEEVAMVMVALESDVGRWTKPHDREMCDALWHDADDELTRRGAQPRDDDDSRA